MAISPFCWRDGPLGGIRGVGEVEDLRLLGELVGRLLLELGLGQLVDLDLGHLRGDLGELVGAILGVARRLARRVVEPVALVARLADLVLGGACGIGGGLGVIGGGRLARPGLGDRVRELHPLGGACRAAASRVRGLSPLSASAGVTPMRLGTSLPVAEAVSAEAPSCV